MTPLRAMLSVPKAFLLSYRALSSSSCVGMPRPKHARRIPSPTGWFIDKSGPGGVDINFENYKTFEATYYTPPGMTAQEIFDTIPDARQHWSCVGQVEKFVKSRAADKAETGYDMLDDPNAKSYGPKFVLRRLRFGRHRRKYCEDAANYLGGIALYRILLADLRKA